MSTEYLFKVCFPTKKILVFLNDEEDEEAEQILVIPKGKHPERQVNRKIVADSWGEENIAHFFHRFTGLLKDKCHHFHLFPVFAPSWRFVDHWSLFISFSSVGFPPLRTFFFIFFFLFPLFSSIITSFPETVQFVFLSRVLFISD